MTSSNSQAKDQVSSIFSDSSLNRKGATRIPEDLFLHPETCSSTRNLRMRPTMVNTDSY